MEHSLSPLLHNTAFLACGLDWLYVALHVGVGSAPAALAGMRAFGLGGLSVTMPHKTAVVAELDELSDDVRLLGAANTVCWNGSRLRGESTDGPGCMDALRAAGTEIAGARAMVLGAGGAARAVVLALARHGAHEIVVVNRTAARAEMAAALAGTCGRVGHIDEVDSCDILINATPVGMGAGTSIHVDPARLGSGQVVNDLVYHPRTTALLAAAATRGARTVGGVAMLLHQAARQFTLWTGEPAPIAAMAAALDASSDPAV